MLDTRVTVIHSSIESFFSDALAVVLSKFISTFPPSFCSMPPRLNSFIWKHPWAEVWVQISCLWLIESNVATPRTQAALGHAGNGFQSYLQIKACHHCTATTEHQSYRKLSDTRLSISRRKKNSSLCTMHCIPLTRNNTKCVVDIVVTFERV